VREASESESEFEDVAEFCRRGPNADYTQGESLAPGEIPSRESDEEVEPLDPKWLEQQLRRRARYILRVKLIVGALSLFVVLALVTRVLNRSSTDSSVVTAAMQPPAALLGKVGLAPATKREAQSPGPWRLLRPAGARGADPARSNAPRARLSTSARMPAADEAMRRRDPDSARPRAEPDAISVPHAAGHAFVKPVSRYVVVTVTAPKVQSHAENIRNASGPPTARFPD
jgi:hypothetical protein